MYKDLKNYLTSQAGHNTAIALRTLLYTVLAGAVTFAYPYLSNQNPQVNDVIHALLAGAFIALCHYLVASRVPAPQVPPVQQAVQQPLPQSVPRPLLASSVQPSEVKSFASVQQPTSA